MTEWDFLTALLSWLDAPGFADAILKVLFAIIAVMIVIEIAPVKSTSELLLPKTADKFMIRAILDLIIQIPRNLTADYTW